MSLLYANKELMEEGTKKLKNIVISDLVIQSKNQKE